MNATAASPDRNDTAKPIATTSSSAVRPDSLRASSRVFAPAPRMIGVARRNEKRVASPRSRPRNRPAEIVMRARDAGEEREGLRHPDDDRVDEGEPLEPP